MRHDIVVVQIAMDFTLSRRLWQTKQDKRMRVNLAGSVSSSTLVQKPWTRGARLARAAFSAASLAAHKFGTPRSNTPAFQQSPFTTHIFPLGIVIFPRLSHSYSASHLFITHTTQVRCDPSFSCLPQGHGNAYPTYHHKLLLCTCRLWNERSSLSKMCNHYFELGERLQPERNSIPSPFAQLLNSAIDCQKSYRRNNTIRSDRDGAFAFSKTQQYRQQNEEEVDSRANLLIKAWRNRRCWWYGAIVACDDFYLLILHARLTFHF